MSTSPTGSLLAPLRSGGLTALLLLAAIGCTQPRDEEPPTPATMDSGSMSPRPDTREPAPPPPPDGAQPPPPDGAQPPPDAGATTSLDTRATAPPDAAAPTPDASPPAPDTTAPPRPDASPPDLAPPMPPPTVATVAATSAPVRLPTGTNVTCRRDDGTPGSPTCPVLRWGDYTYWALSYDDNRIDLDIVAFDRNNMAVKEIPARGTRYIRRITVDVAAETVTFLGQDEGIPGYNPAVTLPWETLRVFPR
jgi:hypothetical protein